MAFGNAQWAVTEYGLETIGEDSGYSIGASRLVETTKRHNGVFYDWPLHMAEKTWVNLAAFLEAFAEALEAHRRRYSPAVDRAMLAASFAEAREIDRRH